MPATSKFTEANRTKVLQALKVGASLRTSARVANISHATLLRWLARGETAREGSVWRQFFLDCEEARAALRVRALMSVWNGVVDSPQLALKVLERIEPAFALDASPTVFAAHQQVIALSFADGKPIAGYQPPVLPAGEDDEDGDGDGAS
jgi:hypothetical protein